MAEPTKELGIEIKVSANTEGVAQATQAISNVGHQAEAAGEKTGAFSKETVKQFSELKSSGREVSEIFRGVGEASEGGLRGVLGALNVLRGTVGILRTLGSVLAGPVGIAFGIAGAGIAAIGRIAERTQKQVEAMFEEHAKESEALKKSYEEIDAASKKSLESQVEEAKKLANSWREISELMKTAEERVKAFNAANDKLGSARLDLAEQKALAAAKSPEERERISADFASKREDQTSDAANRDLVNEGNAARVHIINASAKLEDNKAKLQSIADIASQKGIAFDQAKAAVDDAIASHGFGSHEARVTGGAFARAKQERDDAASNLTKNQEGELGQSIQSLTAEITTANGIVKLVEIQREALITARQVAAQKNVNATEPKIKELGAQAQAALERGDSAAQDKAVAGIQALNSGLAKSNAILLEAVTDHSDAVVARDKAVAGAIDKARASADRTTRQIENMR